MDLNNTGIAQLAERRSPKPQVEGSSPSARAKENAMDKILMYLRESYNELMDKVSWPTRQNLVDSAKVVVVSALMLSVIVFIMDFVVNQVLNFVYSL